MLPLEQLRKEFKKRGLKFTNQRYAIYQALVASIKHPSIEDLFASLKKTHPALSRNTVYNTLEVLKEIGVASEVTLKQERARFDGNQTPHHHCICLSCRKIEDLYDDALNRIPTTPKIRHGYQITSHRVEFQGYCRECQRKNQIES